TALLYTMVLVLVVWSLISVFVFSSRHHHTSNFTLFPYTTLFRSGLRSLRRLMGPRIRPLVTSARLATAPLRPPLRRTAVPRTWEDRKSTRLNSSHVKISYAVFCLKKKRIMSFPFVHATQH